MTDVWCLVFLPFFHTRYTISCPTPSSWHASIDSMSSSHEPAGGLHALDDDAGGVEAPGCAPLLLRERFTGVGFADDGLRPRFLPAAAVAVCLKMASRPPILLKYSSRTSLADSLQFVVSDPSLLPCRRSQGGGYLVRTRGSLRAPMSCPPFCRSLPT